jgi:hypothetical protein
LRQPVDRDWRLLLVVPGPEQADHCDEGKNRRQANEEIQPVNSGFRLAFILGRATMKWVEATT